MLGCFLRSTLDKIPLVESHSVFSQPQSQVWGPKPLVICPEQTRTGQRSLVGYSPWNLKESEQTEWLSRQTHTGRSWTMEGGEIAHCTWLTPNPPSPHSTPSGLSLPICWGVHRSVSIRLSIDALFKPKNVSRIDLSAVLLILQCTLVAGISGSETSNQVQSKS